MTEAQKAAIEKADKAEAAATRAAVLRRVGLGPDATQADLQAALEKLQADLAANEAKLEASKAAARAAALRSAGLGPDATKDQVQAAIDKLQADLDANQAKLAEARAAQPQDPPGVRRCANRGCHHLESEHGGGVCHESHEVPVERTRYVHDLTCTQRHIHTERECYVEVAEKYEDTDTVYCKCQSFDGRTKEQMEAEAEAEATACASCGHPATDHPYTSDSYCRCSVSVRDPGHEGHCAGCGHAAHKDKKKCDFVAHDAHRGPCKHDMHKDPPAVRNIVGDGHYPYGTKCFTCTGYVSRREMNSMSSYEVSRMPRRLGQQ